MALGKNMQIDRLIPTAKDNTSKKIAEEVKADAKVERVEEAAFPPAITEGIKNYPDNIDEQNIKVAFTPSRRKAIRKINVSIDGEFTIKNVTLVKERVCRVFENFDYVDFVFRNISQIDLTAVQLIYTIKSHYSSKEKFITIDAELSKDDRAVMYSSGLMDLLTKQKTI